MGWGEKGGGGCRKGLNWVDVVMDTKGNIDAMNQAIGQVEAAGGEVSTGKKVQGWGLVGATFTKDLSIAILDTFSAVAMATGAGTLPGAVVFAGTQIADDAGQYVHNKLMEEILETNYVDPMTGKKMQVKPDIPDWNATWMEVPGVGAMIPEGFGGPASGILGGIREASQGHLDKYMQTKDADIRIWDDKTERYISSTDDNTKSSQGLTDSIDKLSDAIEHGTWFSAGDPRNL